MQISGPQLQRNENTQNLQNKPIRPEPSKEKEEKGYQLTLPIPTG